MAPRHEPSSPGAPVILSFSTDASGLLRRRGLDKPNLSGWKGARDKNGTVKGAGRTGHLKRER